MSHYKEQIEKFENKPKSDIERRNVSPNKTSGTQAKSDEEIDRLYEKLCPLTID